MGLGIPPLKTKTMLESNPLKFRDPSSETGRATRVGRAVGVACAWAQGGARAGRAGAAEGVARAARAADLNALPGGTPPGARGVRRSCVRCVGSSYFPDPARFDHPARDLAGLRGPRRQRDSTMLAKSGQLNDHHRILIPGI